MKITLVYNPQAGGSPMPVEDLVKGLEKRGADVLTQDAKEEDYQQALGYPCDFVIIAGGDGTIEKVAKQIIKLGKGVPIAILPFGNANNIAGSLDVDTTLGSIVASWREKDFRKFSVGSINIAGSNRNFFESVGWGLFAEVLEEVKAEKKARAQPPVNAKDKVESGLKRLSQRVQELQPSFYQILLDEVDYSGYYLWVEVMNTQSMGPQLQLAPDARHGDQFLDVVLIKEEEKARLEDFLNVRNGENHDNLFNPIKTQKIKIRSNQSVHIDDEMFQVEDPSAQWAEIRLIAQPMLVLNAQNER